MIECEETQKHCYPDKRLADIILDTCKKRRRKEKSSYQCKFCDQWHLTSGIQR